MHDSLRISLITCDFTVQGAERAITRSLGFLTLVASHESRQAVCEKLSFSVQQGRATCRSMAQREKRGAILVRQDSAKQGVEMEA
jgi:hypothetical protein